MTFYDRLMTYSQSKVRPPWPTVLWKSDEGNPTYSTPIKSQSPLGESLDAQELLSTVKVQGNATMRCRLNAFALRLHYLKSLWTTRQTQIQVRVAKPMRELVVSKTA